MNRELLARLISSTVEAAVRRVPTPTWRPGTVASVASVHECAVVIDGDSEATVANPGGLPVAAGDRVMVLFYPPRGVMVTARLAEPAAYALMHGAGAASLADAETTYWGGSYVRAPQTTPNIRRLYIPRRGTIRSVQCFGISTSNGTAEAWTINLVLNNTTTYLVETLSVATSGRFWSNYAMQVPVEQGDYVEMQSVQPTWATNPLGTVFGGNILVA